MTVAATERAVVSCDSIAATAAGRAVVSCDSSSYREGNSKGHIKSFPRALQL